MWGDTAKEVYEKGRKLIHILVDAGFAMKRNKDKGPAQEIRFLGVKWQDECRHIPMDVVIKITAMSPRTTQEDLGFLRSSRLLEDAHSYARLPQPQRLLKHFVM